MRLNVGCGEFMADGWWNIDMIEIDDGYNIHPDQIVDVSKPLPENIENLTMVYMGHFLEHIRSADHDLVFHNVKKKMLKGARICVVGPDVDKAKILFEAGKIDEALYKNCQEGAGAAHWDGDYHHWSCTEERVIRQLRWSGFNSVRPVSIYSSELNDWPVTARTDWQCAVLAEV